MDRTEFIKQMIGKYQRKIELYQAMIGELELELGDRMTIGDAIQVEVSPDDRLGKKVEDTALPGAAIRDYQFWGKSQPEAAKLMLDATGHPLRTEAIVAGIEKGGVKVGGKTARDKKLNLYSILNRSDDFVRIAADTWALAGWPGVTKKAKGAVPADGQPKAQEEKEEEIEAEK